MLSKYYFTEVIGKKPRKVSVSNRHKTKEEAIAQAKNLQRKVVVKVGEIITDSESIISSKPVYDEVNK